LKPVAEQMKTLMRGVDYGDPAIRENMEEELRERLSEGRPLKVYLGVDPTSPDIHLGHMVPLMKLKQFQDLGHEVTFLIGDFTGMVGDPSGRTKTRPMLTREQLEINMRTYTDQAFNVLDRSKTKVRYNSEWLAGLTFADVVKVASNLTVAQLLERDYFRRRYEAGEAIRLHEFLYCLMQGYDAFMLETDVQVGGVDQLFNLLVGRDVQRANGQRPQVVVTVPLLVGTDGAAKMSKSLGNAIGIAESPPDMFGKVMSLPDDVMTSYFTLVTEIETAEIAEMEEGVRAGALHPMDVKKRLAREIVGRFHGREAASQAEGDFRRHVQEKKIPDDVPVVEVPADKAREISVVELAMMAKMAPSKSAVRRLIDQGGVEMDGARVTDRDATTELRDGALLRVGKRKFVRFKVLHTTVK
jgi:tyrosyl-tRNA synthetase